MLWVTGAGVPAAMMLTAMVALAVVVVVTMGVGVKAELPADNLLLPRLPGR